jgi:hypothetical protein
VFDFVSSSLFSGLGSLALLVVGWLTQKYVLPLISTEQRKRMAEHILLIADEVTSSLMLKYPNSGWASWLDQAVEEIMRIAGVSKEVALRAVKAALVRKGVKK